MYFDEYGNRKKATIVLLHGAALTDTFSNQYVFQQDYHLVVPHLYGSGREVAESYEPQKTIAALVDLIRALNKPPVMLVGHSLGGELAVALVSQHPELFARAVFLSPWVCATPKSIDRFVQLGIWTQRTARLSGLLRLQAKYWHLSKGQEDFLVDYTKKITPEQYVAWFKERIFLDEQPNYAQVNIPMLAVCGEKEFSEIKTSVVELGNRNQNCQTLFLKGGRHDFPLRMPAVLNPLLSDFFSGGMIKQEG